MFGTVGGIFEFRAALLASRGFACLCLAYFHYEDLPRTLDDVDFDYFMVSQVKTSACRCIMFCLALQYILKLK